MAFNKFEPHRHNEAEESEAGAKRARWFKILWWFSTGYTAIGFAFLVIFAVKGNPF